MTAAAATWITFIHGRLKPAFADEPRGVRVRALDKLMRANLKLTRSSVEEYAK
ncbi:MAG: hypothetical protein NVSMB6_28770 [Burkholderiaceae bacterium]